MTKIWYRVHAQLFDFDEPKGQARIIAKFHTRFDAELHCNTDPTFVNP